jgi:shikimate kinase
MNELIYLIGYRGCGKSTAGKLLAEKLHWNFIDADQVLEAREGRSIRAIFSEEGEPYFRDIESEVLLSLSKGSKTVVATGGGVILRPQNREILRDTGFVVWLTAPAEALWERIQVDPVTHERRPNLGVGGLCEVAELLAYREPLYFQTAHLEIPAANQSPEQSADAILSAWRTACSPGSPKSSG